MVFLPTARVQCPYCWQDIEVVVDTSVDNQEYTEDCEVCCRPMLLRVVLEEDGTPNVEARREND